MRFDARLEVLYKLIMVLAVVWLVGSCSRNPDSPNEIFVYEKKISVAESVEKMKQDRSSKSLKKILSGIRKEVVRHVIRDIPDPGSKDIELWCRGYMLNTRGSEEKIRETVQAERWMLYESIRRDFPAATLPATRPDRFIDQKIKDAETQVPGTLNFYLRQFPTLADRRNRLKALDAAPPWVVLWKDWGIRELKITRFAAGHYGVEAVEISDAKVDLQVRYLEAKNRVE